MFHVPEKFRMRTGNMRSEMKDGNNGVFSFTITKNGPVQQKVTFIIIASDGYGWEHVSVRASQLGKSRIPYWDEMCIIKDTFWDAEDAVMQLHPPSSQYVNMHKDVLHLWRPVGTDIPLPPTILVGLPPN